MEFQPLSGGRNRRGLMIAALAVFALFAAACASPSAGGTGDPSESQAGEAGGVELSLVAYSTPQPAYEKIIAAFQETPEGEGVTFTQSYGASGDQSRAVEAGLKADIVGFSLAPDMKRLVEAGIVADDWADTDTDGFVTKSVVVLATRKGNPEGIEDWDDLTADGLEVITPNPFTSGGARWNVMAAYGAASDVAKDDDDGVQYLHELFANVAVQDESARKSLQTFTSGKGDVLLAYENEAIFAQQEGQALDYVMPDETILIENPVAVTKDSEHPEEAQAFLDFLFTEEAQRIFADNGYRPVVEGVADGEFEEPAGVFTIEDLGGWDTVMSDFFDPAGSVMADVEASIGVSVDQG
jgi:sulfate transport system substrate-binding protein